MSQSAFGQPLLINENENISLLKEVSDYNEAYIQDLIFKYPECLPVSDIDESFNPLISVCKELRTPVGPLDILLVNPKGDIAIVETKLWRNPEARRKVIAQILDYARELSKWNYEDLQREVNRNLNTKGNILYQIASKSRPNEVLKESNFVDAISRNLKKGNFLLLIAGDGIKEGARGITEFLNQSGNLNFSFGMVDLSVYQAEGIGRLIVPKTIVKTTEITRYTIDLQEGLKIVEAENILENAEEINQEWEAEKQFYFNFWAELQKELILDDPGQPLGEPIYKQNYFLMPSTSSRIWISAFFSKSSNRVGVYLGASNNKEGRKILEEVTQDKEALFDELAIEIPDNYNLKRVDIAEYHCSDPLNQKKREQLKEFFKFWLNRFVNAYRPRLKELGY